MPYIQKSRVRDGRRWSYSSSSYGKAGASYSGSFPREVQWIQTENHPGFRKPNGLRDVGGVFESYKLEIPVTGIDWTSRYNYVVTTIPGGPNGWQNDTSCHLVASSEVVNHASSVSLKAPTTTSGIQAYLSARVPPGPNTLTLDAMGTKAIDMCKPTNPSFDLATTLGELWSERKFFSTPGLGDDLSGEYLNYQFGIAPTISDFKTLRETIENRDAILRQYQRDAEKLIRRKYHFKPEITVDTVTSNAPVAAMGGGLSFQQNPGGTLVKTTTTTQKFWFAAAFRYTIPKDRFPQRIAELDHLYGVIPGLSTGWELTPFSWLVDYFVPVGSLLDNMDAFIKDGLVMPYAYIMSTTEVRDTYTWRGPVVNSAGAFTNIGVTSIVKKTRLRRKPATPFGFGLLASDLTPTQLTILAALGMSLPRK